jgi:heat shock protein HtpX
MKRMMLMRTFQNATVWFMFAQGFKQFVRWVICWGAELYILAFSRKREYWADAIGAALTSKEAMIGALKKLAEAPPLTDAENTHARFMVRGRISSAFSTHPSFEERIVALQHETYLRQLPSQRI